jgi:glyoxylase-like metal-dependent hydrolase (beta-lactamase superfamily II)
MVLRPLHVGDCHGKEGQVVEGGGGHVVPMPVYAWVLEHPTEGLVAIDVGYPEESEKGGSAYPGKVARDVLQLGPTRALRGALREIGRAPEELRTIVVTHLHGDHAGGVMDLPGATLVVSSGEWWTLGSRKGPLGDDARAWRGHGKRREIAYNDGPMGPFAAHEDLFGDGSVLLFPTPGHTAGHSSVLVNLPGAPVLLLGDAAWVDRGWQEPAPKGALPRQILEDDWRLGMEALWKVRAWKERVAGLQVLAGHEPSLRERLPPWPQPWPAVVGGTP